MSNDKGKKTIVLVQEWGAGKIAIGSEFKLKESDRILVLTQCDGYPNGKFVFTDGEIFDVGKYFDAYFVEINKEKEESKENKDTVYNEEVWDSFDTALNGKTINGKLEPFRIKDENKPLILKTFGEEQKNHSFRDFAYYDVTEIIEEIIKDKKVHPDNKMAEELFRYFNDINFHFFTKEKLVILLNSCEFEKTKYSFISKVKQNNKIIGHLILEGNRYMFSPISKVLTDEYSFESNNSTGFYYTAESYLDVALNAIERYKKEFIPLYHTTSEKNKESYGYQADSTIRTLLAFSCECYLKSLLIAKGKSLDDIKKLGHGLSALYTALDSDEIANVFRYMKINGYEIPNRLYNQVYETNDLTEKFMLDLARVDAAFIDSRYCAEKDKNTDYNFLYEFAISLRDCARKEFMISSPFTGSIESKIGMTY